jgi:SAM-dependent methyltransferase
VEDNSKDYIISSHVVEHVPNLIGAFQEWNRILKKDGIIFMIFPKRDALPADVGRAISTVAKFDFAYSNTTCDINVHEHVWVFTLESMIELIEHCNKKYDLNWEILETEQTDSKVGNGHTAVCKKK